jgi:hypothetical protein
MESITVAEELQRIDRRLYWASQRYLDAQNRGSGQDDEQCRQHSWFWVSGWSRLRQSILLALGVMP